MENDIPEKNVKRCYRGYRRKHPFAQGVSAERKSGEGQKTYHGMLSEKTISLECTWSGE
jgi:hypothetical protein